MYARRQLQALVRHQGALEARLENHQHEGCNWSQQGDRAPALPSMCEALVADPVERSLLNASLGERPRPDLERCDANNEHEPGHNKENQGPENPAGTEDWVPSNHRRGDATKDDDDDPRNGEEAIASNDPIDRMSQQTWVAGTSRVRMPKQARRNVPEEGDDGSEVKKLEPEVHDCSLRRLSPVCLTDRA